MQSYCLYIYNIAYIHTYIYIKTVFRDIQTVVIKTCAYTNRYALNVHLANAMNYNLVQFIPTSSYFSSTEG